LFFCFVSRDVGDATASSNINIESRGNYNSRCAGAHSYS
jgi:hypothetical protein